MAARRANDGIEPADGDLAVDRLDDPELDGAAVDDAEAYDADAYDPDAFDADDDHDDPIPWLFRSHRNIAWVLLVCGAIGLVASFSLTMEYLHKLQDPSAGLICDINPFITCGPAMLSWAGSILGFPNIIIGLVAFSLTITMAMGIFAGARFRPWFWVGYQIGLVGAAALITFLQWFSAYDLGRLCLWCMIIWAGTIPLVALTTIFNLVQGHLGRGAQRVGRAIAPWAVTIVIIWYLAVIGFVLAGMWNVISLSFI